MEGARHQRTSHLHIRSLASALGIAGPNGAGKTTLISLLLGLYTPQRGDVLVDGIRVQDWDPASLHAQIGIVPQEVFLFHDTIRNNITCRLPSVSETDLVEAATRAGAHDFISRLPGGYDTVIGDAGQTLSGGERQRLALARALVGNPNVLVLDEPGTYIDRDAMQHLQATLQQASVGRTTLLISHQAELLAHADHVLEVGEGRDTSPAEAACLQQTRAASTTPLLHRKTFSQP